MISLREKLEALIQDSGMDIKLDRFVNDLEGDEIESEVCCDSSASESTSDIVPVGGSVEDYKSEIVDESVPVPETLVSSSIVAGVISVESTMFLENKLSILAGEIQDYGATSNGADVKNISLNESEQINSIESEQVADESKQSSDQVSLDTRSVIESQKLETPSQSELQDIDISAITASNDLSTSAVISSLNYKEDDDLVYYESSDDEQSLITNQGHEMARKKHGNDEFAEVVDPKRIKV